MQQKHDNLGWPKAVTLVEMVVAMSIMAIVLAAVLPLFAGVRNNWDARQANMEIVQNARVLADHFYRTLATATEITDVSPSTQEVGFIEFKASDGGLHRYDVGPDGYVQFGLSGEPDDLAGPVSRFRLTCYDANDLATPTVEASSIRFVTAETTFINDTPLGADKTFTARVYVRAGALNTDGEEEGFTPGVALRESFEWGGNKTYIDSYRSSQGPYNPTRAGAEAVVSVNAITSGAISLWTSAVIYGDAYVGPGGNPDTGIVTWGASQITGRRAALLSPVDIPVLSAPTGPPFNGPSEALLKMRGQDVETIESDRYFDGIDMSGQAVLFIEGHVTLLLEQGLETGGQAELRILPNSSATIYVRQDVDVSANSRLNATDANPSQLRIHMIGNGKNFQVGSNAVVQAVLQNPQGSVSFSNGGEFFGKIKAGRLKGSGRIHVDFDCDF